jgi:hypothetical protein
MPTIAKKMETKIPRITPSAPKPNPGPTYACAGNWGKNIEKKIINAVIRIVVTP